MSEHIHPQLIALYLPQYHPIPENNRWWGPGFTEWTNVAKARPLFRGHHQPHIPADLGFYDLRLPEVREQQARLALESGIAAFCYYHYWFHGKQLLERPFREVVASGSPDFPFCLCWANHSWSSATWTAHGKEAQLLMQQTYSAEDDVSHFYALLDAFRDKRYYKIDGKLVFVVYDVWGFERVSEYIATWRTLAEKEGLPGFHFIGMTPNTLTFDPLTGKRMMPDLNSSAHLYQGVLDKGFDAVNSSGMRRGEMLSEGRVRNLSKTVLRKVGLPVGRFFDYSKTVRGFFAPEDRWENVYPTIMPNWDRSPRAATLDGIYVHTNPQAFEKHIRQALEYIRDKQDAHQVLFLKSWNEWGEGNYVEPDLEFGHGWLEAIRKKIMI